MAQTVIGLTPRLDQAEMLVDRLKTAGFSSNDISILLPDKEGTQDFAHKNTTKAPEGAATGASTGGVIGGTLGWLAGIGIPEYEAKMYEGKIREGNILIAAHSDNKDMLKAAEDIFKELGVKDVHRTSEAKVEKK